MLQPLMGLVLQGLFRLAAAASVVKRLKTCLDQGTVDHSEFSMDPHAVAGGALSTFFTAPCSLAGPNPTCQLLFVACNNVKCED